MLRVDKVIKPWKDSACLNDHINLYGFWNETAFLTKSGDVGMVLSVPGVDYESLDRSEQEYAVKRLEAALKAFGPGFHVYQYLFKSNRPDIPFGKYDDPIVDAAIEQRRKFFEAKRDHLYQVEIFYCILLEGARSKTGVGAAFSQLFRDPAGAIGERYVGSIRFEEILVNMEAWAEGFQSGFQPLHRILLLRAVEAFVVHTGNTEHHAHIAGLGKKGRLIPEAVQVDVVVETRALFPRLDDFIDSQHHSTSTRGMSCLAAS